MTIRYVASLLALALLLFCLWKVFEAHGDLRFAEGEISVSKTSSLDGVIAPERYIESMRKLRNTFTILSIVWFMLLSLNIWQIMRIKRERKIALDCGKLEQE